MRLGRRAGKVRMGLLAGDRLRRRPKRSALIPFGTQFLPVSAMAHIFLIDDDDNVRRLLACVLWREGHEITKARDRPEGIALQYDRSADRVIMDIVMPDMENPSRIRSA